jgi:hypothetical protein
VCDDVRIERNGKEIIIGVYNDNIISPVIPLFLPTICFRVSVRLNKQYKSASVTLKDPAGKPLFVTTGPVAIQNTNEQTIFNFQMAGAQFPSPGRYTFYFGLDREPEEVGSFIIRPPETDEEKSRTQV